MTSGIAALTGRAWALEESVLRALIDDLRSERQPLAVTQPRPATRPKPGLGVLPLFGLIEHRASFLSLLFGTGTALTDFQASLRQLVADQEVGAIIMLVDSPGGSVDALQETAALLRAARRVKPITAIVDTTAASAAYWLAAQAAELVLTPSGWVGSIGVFTTHMDVSAALEKAGVKVTLISAGKYKTEGNPYAGLSKEALAYAQSIADSYYGQFLDDVALGRRVSPSKVRTEYGEGRMLLAADALAAGMVDRIGTLEDVLAEASVRAAPADASFRGELRRFKVAARTTPEPFGTELARHRRALSGRGPTEKGAA